MTTTQEHIDQLASATDRPRAGIMDKALCVRLQLHKPGRTRKVPSNTQIETPDTNENQPELIEGAAPAAEATRNVKLINEEVKTDLTMLKVSKHIFDAEEFSAIVQLDTRIRNFMMTKALPSIFQRGVYLVPDEMVGEVDHVLTNYLEAREQLVDVLIEALPTIIENAKSRLGPLFNDEDYAEADALRKLFSMRWDYVSYGVNEKLKKINSALYRREQEKSAQRFAEAESELKNAMRVALADLVDHLVEKLSPDANGKVRMLSKTALPALSDFIGSFNSRNICDDAALASLVKKAQDIASGVDRKDLKKNEGLRDSVLKGFQEVKAALDPMVVRKGRKFRFGDDEEED